MDQLPDQSCQAWVALRFLFMPLLQAFKQVRVRADVYQQIERRAE